MKCNFPLFFLIYIISILKPNVIILIQENKIHLLLMLIMDVIGIVEIVMLSLLLLIAAVSMTTLYLVKKKVVVL